VAVIAPESLEVKTEAAQLRAARAATPAELAARDFSPSCPEVPRWPPPFRSSPGR